MVDLKNDENYVLGFKDIANKRYYRDQIFGVSSFKFMKNHNIVLYVKYDETRRSNRVYKHILGQEQKSDQLILEEKDDKFNLNIGISKDKKYLVINSTTKEISEVNIINRETDSIQIDCIFPKSLNSKAFCSHAEDKFLMLTDLGESVYDL